MTNPFTKLLTAVLLLAVASTASAQAPAPPAAYQGPRYPGGPDSLRAFVYRSTRLLMPAPAGRMLAKFELQPDGQPHRFSVVRPPAPLNKSLIKVAASVLPDLEARMPAWQLGTPAPKAAPGTAPKVTLLLDFSTPQAAQPYSYADQMPQFDPAMSVWLAKRLAYIDRKLENPAQAAAFASSPQGLASYIQMQVRYPAEALRADQQGEVNAYFEVAENGAIENAQILGTAGQALDAEVLRVVQRLPAATAPALLRGKPARVYYVLPVTFKIQ
ncbi:energy transducer TonB [Hymenobacter sp. BT770]|uniref:energy transducer TonB n=1 Tax=Hymenobacter sp. BT770 TaxID=2886942 RepID=UPI001D12A631|nr:energy transducer TonB [Hymenobacter sp. BT770]MCC3154397.1 energy transducer TonB [Hymenobacter sp. BT770]MDO3416268.1 energy transducer TonB [Hymenobacter sp. BT770]